MYRRAFTLIELLVVISIVGLLSSVVLASLDSARAKARDAKRFSDVDALVKAVSMYFSDNGTYPSSGGTSCIGLPTGSTCWGDRNVAGDTTLMTRLSPYISTFPTDPLKFSNWNDYYVYLSGSYTIGCNSSNDTGQFILYRPDIAGSGSNFSCPVNATKGCCAPSMCGNSGGWFCARKINN